MSPSTLLAEKKARKPLRWTYERLCAELEETTQPCELWHGQLIMSPAPTPFHQLIALRLQDALYRWVDQRKLGVVLGAPSDVVLAPDLALQPDVLFIAKARQSIIKTHINGAPDLVMEVVSPDRPRRDYKDKKDQYETHGVKEYWIVDPDRKRIEVWSLQGDYYQLVGAYSGKQTAASALLSGFSVRVDRVIAQGW
jgi:Uma2 family endonuclease